LIGPWADEKAGFQEITKIYYTAGFFEPGPNINLTFNLDVYESLTPAQQSIVSHAAQSANIWSMSQFMTNNSAALQRLQAAGVKLMEFPDSVWDAFGTASQEVVQEPMDDPLYKKCHDSYMSSLRKSAAWSSVSEAAFARQRNRVVGI
jgi:TRAP-type mannitol/chloroaromatic compound transport system substrate-binding protein